MRAFIDEDEWKQDYLTDILLIDRFLYQQNDAV